MTLSASAPLLTSRRRAFTLLELIVVLVVLGLLAAIAIPTYQAIINGSSERAELSQLEAVVSAAVATAALDREPLSVEHFDPALVHLYEASGVGEHASGAVYTMYTQAEWAASQTYPTDGTRPLVFGTVGEYAGVATIAAHDPSLCVMARVASRGTAVQSHLTNVDDALSCDAPRAAAGPGADAPAATTTTVPQAPARNIATLFSTTTGKLDDLEIRAGNTVVGSDDFNRADGPIAAGGTVQWVDTSEMGIPAAVISGGALTGPTNTEDNIAITSSPAGVFAVSATLTALPTDGYLQLIVGDLGNSEAQFVFGQDAGGGSMYAWAPVACPTNLQIAALDTQLSAGDRVTITRTTDTTGSLSVNGQVVQHIDRAAAVDC